MRDRTAMIAFGAALAGALGLCCGLPILLSLGVVGTVAGWSLQSWFLVGAGLTLATLGTARHVVARTDPTKEAPHEAEL